MLDRAVGFFMKRYRCGRRFAALLLFGLAVDLALFLAAVALSGRLFGMW